jgi:hypothetical protein
MLLNQKLLLPGAIRKVLVPRNQKGKKYGNENGLISG